MPSVNNDEKRLSRIYRLGIHPQDAYVIKVAIGWDNAAGEMGWLLQRYDD